MAHSANVTNAVTVDNTTGCNLQCQMKSREEAIRWAYDAGRAITESGQSQKRVHLVWQQLLIAKYLKDATMWTLMQVFDVTHQLHKLC